MLALECRCKSAEKTAYIVSDLSNESESDFFVAERIGDPRLTNSRCFGISDNSVASVWVDARMGGGSVGGDGAVRIGVCIRLCGCSAFVASDS